MRVLLTGARGFIGRRVLRKLAAEGHEVVALGSGGQPPASAATEWWRLDLLAASTDHIAALVEKSRVTHCLHAAWYTDHRDYLHAAVNEDWRDASLRLAAGFYAGGGRRLVALGTCLEYDQRADEGRFSELGTPLRPDTLYARCKAALRAQLAEDAEASGADGAWARVFFVYGPGDRAGRLIHYILAKLAAGDRARPHYGGLLRDYLHVDDLAGQLVSILKGPVQGAINTGTGEAVAIGEIFRTAGDVAGRPDLIDANDRVDQSQRLRIEADMARFRAEVGAVRTRPLAQGLAQLWKSCR